MSIGSSAKGEKLWTFGMEGSYRRKQGRSNRQASATGVVPAEGSPILKSASICGNFGRKSENESFAQSFDVGLCTNCCGGNMCPWKLGSVVENIGMRLPLRKEVFLCLCVCPSVSRLMPNTIG
ncbi:unnamed protein product [Prunus armeniaca]